MGEEKKQHGRARVRETSRRPRVGSWGGYVRACVVRDRPRVAWDWSASKGAEQASGEPATAAASEASGKAGWLVLGSDSFVWSGLDGCCLAPGARGVTPPDS